FSARATGGGSASGSSTASPLSASCASDSTTGAARRTNPRVCVAARPLTSRKTEPVSASVLARALRCASHSTTVPVSSTSPHTPSTSFARKLRLRVVAAAGGEGAAAVEGVIASAYSIVDKDRNDQQKVISGAALASVPGQVWPARGTGQCQCDDGDTNALGVRHHSLPGCNLG